MYIPDTRRTLCTCPFPVIAVKIRFASHQAATSILFVSKEIKVTAEFYPPLNFIINDPTSTE